jgi:hypothetical protein
MGLIVIIAFLATVGFYRRAKQIGIHPGKAASIPFIGAGLMLVFSYLASLGLGRLLSITTVSDWTVYLIARAIDCCLILAYCYYIKRNWDVLARSSRLQSEESTSRLGGLVEPKDYEQE